MARRQFAAGTYRLLHRHHRLGISHYASMLVGWCSVAEIVSCGPGAIRRCTERRHDRADDELADVVGGIPRCRGRMVSDVAVENVEWAGRGIPNVYHCRCGVFGCGATRAKFDLLYLDGYDWRKVALEERKKKLASILVAGDSLRYSDHYEREGKALFEIARQKGLEGILAKKRDSVYQERRSSEWLKIKIRHRIECVIGGYTEPEGSRAYFGSIVLGLYDEQRRLIHVGQAGSGFNQKSLGEIWKMLQKRETKQKPFYGEVEALRKVFWVKPELVAEIEYAEWTDGASGGSGPKLRAPVFLGLRDDKDPKECLLEEAMQLRTEN